MATTRRTSRRKPGRGPNVLEKRAYRRRQAVAAAGGADAAHAAQDTTGKPLASATTSAATASAEAVAAAGPDAQTAVTQGAAEAEESAELGFLGQVDHPRARAFLRHYARTGNVTEAARAAGVARNLHYYWLEHLPGYREAAAQAEQMAADALEREAWRRAVEGWDEPVYQKGQLVGTVRRYSDVLMTLLLRGLRPERYRERVDIGSEPGRPVQVQLAPQDEEAARRLIEVMAARRLGNAESGATTGPEALR